MFECGLFLLVDWHEYASSQLPALGFLRSDICTVPPSQIPDTSVGSAPETSTANAKLHATITSERKELVVEAVYEVTVAGRNGCQQVKQLTRHVNILRIALLFVCAYCHCGEHVVLGAHHCMLRTIYRISLSLRDLFQTRIVLGERETVSPSLTTAEKVHTPTAAGTTANMDAEGHESDTAEIPQITLKEMLPGRSERDKVIAGVLKVSQETFARISAEAPLDESSVSALRSSNDRSDSDDLDEEFDSDGDVMDGMFS